MSTNSWCAPAGTLWANVVRGAIKERLLEARERLELSSGVGWQCAISP